MKKIIYIYGQRVELYSSDEGHTWSSNPQSIAAYEQRKDTSRLELKQKFAWIDEMPDPEPNIINQLSFVRSRAGR